MNKTTWMIVAGASALAVALRIADLPWLNFSALAALFVLCGAVVRPTWLGILIPLGCRLLTDLFVSRENGFGDVTALVFVYAAYSVIFALARWLQPQRIKSAFGTGLLAATAFFLITNFGSWYMPYDGVHYMYPQTLNGLLSSYINGIWFARGTFLGDVGFTILFIGMMQLQAMFVKNEATVATSTTAADL
ncbi:MAG TPA: hypothetical protein PLY87_03055 [Planctomycetaceae bacterium]|nr:hypothetical protein [Planctomycetaceae bacterium]HQZ64023.1 hypothetical protein [Planctomycetaceae bacterium]